MSLKTFYLNLVRISKQLIQKLTVFQIQPRIIAIIAVIISSLILVLYFIPASQVFEGNLIVEEMSFSLDKQNPPDKLFLNSIRSLNKIEIEGKLKFSLLGIFEDSLKNINTLEVNLISDASKLIIESLDRKASQLELNQLRLQSETIVKKLNYDSSNSQLSLSLEPGETPNFLRLSLGEKPLKISIENYQLTHSDTALNSLPYPYLLNFNFTPLATEFNLNLPEISSLYINLPNPTKLNTQEWILGNSTVNNVKFSRFIETENRDDDLEVSTILKGKIRMSDQNLELEANQFLIPVPYQPGIQLLRQFQIHQEKPQGLEIRFRGHAEKIQAGIDPNFPVNSIQVNFLNKHFSREAVSALLAFCAAILGALLPGLSTKD